MEKRDFTVQEIIKGQNDKEKLDYMVLTNSALRTTSQKLFEVALENPNSNDYKSLDTAIDLIISREKFSQFIRLFQIEKLEIKKYLEKKLDLYLQKKFCLTSLKSSQYGLKDVKIEQNLLQMIQLENEYPGSVKKLLETYNIKEFYRYPTEVLISQLKEEEVNQPYGIAVYSRSDHYYKDESALDQVKPVLLELFHQTREHLGLKVFEASTKRDIAKMFINLDKKYGLQNKINFMIIEGHGNGDFIRLGEDDFQKGNTGKIIENSDFEQSQVENKKVDDNNKKGLSKFFEPKPTIILVSCLAGKKNGIKDKMLKKYCDANIIASDKKTNVEHINVKYDENGIPIFEVLFYNMDNL